MAFAAEHGAADFRLERHLVVLAAVVANDFKTFGRIIAERRFFAAAFRAPLRRHHVSLIKGLLLFFSKNKGVSALNTRSFNVRHIGFLPVRGR